MRYRNLFIGLQLAILFIGCVQGQEVMNGEEVMFHRVELAKTYAIENGLDTNHCILVDMSIHSGKYRLFVYDIENQKVMKSGLCAHGDCKEGGTDTASFSNTPDTHCSSLGFYKIGIRSYSNWGVNFHYKLHGLEPTNNNAYKRIIVLHSYDWVEDKEVYPEYCITSWGCPMVSNNMMNYLDTIIKSTNQPMLLWIYKSE